MRLELPFPVSVNAMYGKNRYRVHPSKSYAKWIKAADDLVTIQKAAKTIGSPIAGHFTYHLVLSEAQRVYRGNARDGDNFTKVVLDYLQRIELIENDKFADSGTWAWGPCDGAVITVHRSLIQRAA